MSGPDIAGLVGVTICIAGFVALAIAAVTIVFPPRPKDFASPADERKATQQVDEHRAALPGQPR